MQRPRVWGYAGLLFLCTHCGVHKSDGAAAPPSAGPVRGETSGDVPFGSGGAQDVPPGPVPSGSVPAQRVSSQRFDLVVVADVGAAQDAVVSAGIPLPPGLLKNANLLRLLRDGQEVAVHVSPLAFWPQDGSIRSILVAFRATMPASSKVVYQVDVGTARTTTSPVLAANPDGPVSAYLRSDTYSAFGALGAQLPAAKNRRFDSYDDALERELGDMSPAYESYGISCNTTANKRTYYDAPHAHYQRFVRFGDSTHYRRARAEARWYRQNELRWLNGRTMAVQSCQSSSWTVSKPLDWAVLRTMLGQGMLDDYLLTGDPAALEAVVALGETYRQNLPALTGNNPPEIEMTERNLAWPLMGLTSAYAATQRNEYRVAAQSLVDRTIAWQRRSSSGALEHDMNRPDPDECSDGPNGASPFMTSLVVDGLMDYFTLTSDPRIPEVIGKFARWYETQATTSDRKAFRYIWGCRSDSYDSSDTADLNLLIVHVFGAAYALTKNTHWLDVGDQYADSGIDAMYVGRPKQWNQATRSFGKYLGYRALGRTP